MYKSIIIDTETTRLPIKKEPKNNKIAEKIKTYLVLFSFQLKLENFKEKNWILVTNNKEKITTNEINI